MKHRLLSLLAVCAMSFTAFAQTWTAPVEPTKPATPEGLDFESSTAIEDLTEATAFYIRNVGSGQFIVGANSWGTQISLSTNSVPYLPINVEPSDGGYTLTPVAGTYLFHGTTNGRENYNCSLNGTSQKLFRDSEESGFVDLGSQNKGYIWNIIKVGDYYRIQTADSDPGVGNWPNYQEQYAGATVAGAPVKFNLTEQDPGIDWEFIPVETVDLDAVNAIATQYEAEMTAYNKAMELYNARVILYEILLDAATYGADTAEAGAVYNNPDATTANVTAATTALRALVRTAIVAYVNANPNVASPVNLSKYLLENADFSAGNISGWTIEKPAGASGNYQYQGATYMSADSTSIIKGFIESWVPAPNHLGNVQIFQEIIGLPNGHYILECDAMALNQSENESDDYIAKEDYTGVYLYYSDGVITMHSDALASDRDDTYDDNSGNWSHTWRPAHFVFEFDLSTTSDTITIGLMADNTNLNWMGADNFKLTYTGVVQTLPSYTALVAEVATSEDYLASEPVAQTAALQALSDAITSAKTLTTAPVDNSKDAEYKAAYTVLNTARMNVVASVEAYAKLEGFIEKLYDETAKYENSSNYESLVTAIETLREKMEGAVDNKDLSAEEINAAIDGYDAMVASIVKEIFDAAVAANEPLDEPLDITSFFDNMSFEYGTSQVAFAGGYPADAPVWMNETSDGNFKTNYSTAEVWNNRPFNIYRDFTNLPKGSYTIQTHAFFRVEANDANYSNWQANSEYGKDFAYIYAGENKTSLINVASIACPEFVNLNSPYDCTDGNYIPNNQQSAYRIFTESQFADQAEMCLVSATGNVLSDGGTLRVGIAGTDQLQGNHWTIWYGFSLLYNGAVTSDAISTQLEALMNEAAEADAHGVAEGINKLDSALVQGQTALDNVDADEMTAAIEVLTDALAYVAASESLVNELMEKAMDYETRMGELFGNYTDTQFQTLLDAINETGYEDFESNAQIEAWLAQFQPLWYAYILSDEGISEATVEEPYDMTTLLVNPSFDNSWDGWTYTTSRGNPGIESGSGNCPEFWSTGTFDIYQEIPTLAEGYWRLEVDALYRPGNSDNVVSALNAADSTLLDHEYLYVHGTGLNGEVKVVAWSDTINGAYINNDENADIISTLNKADYTCNDFSFVAPNNRAGFKTFVAQERYHNVIDFKYEPTMGAVRFGIRLEDDITAGACWCPFDDFKLSYLGTEAPDAVQDINAATNATRAAQIFSIDGRQQNALRRGINIVRNANGTVQKVLVK